ncbi:D-alanyl-D-alanine-carboxypeptidase/endopeptidase AmpH [Xenorhabdus bovienii]|uniref:D-alanyl-D-alanine- carboxypeptidase/endopeptidase AmpH n=1 Tax=Xenorhabdus bovienii TaxID=40576 RepID=UPI0023B30065|nr:D-alanyl-D-alanine-carboxypeptidase/endopeptidase AmpH [Xenorhabdus bovienii]MDE9432172.1 D-alanyl-D-alanine-carboxypeptidase/endopeptidase AmpH [Xenorhabdus bovienii]MDE9490133.1 D-alanyl-D-alanine-carboxypeptidase/endopeptidase AmpH [Xenorhabdus bovienii]MDE9506409.1 D-alanyl-D-alanine-carboxypeptidase/endopeptidase AmpH [Xenorhabdus bovienii]MDE9546579.1 D-alanyl-D-alanine-carboxypeptidase/endopeptidase AmpH [Xenorhabdus bovienii]
MNKQLYKFFAVSALSWALSACAAPDNAHQNNFPQSGKKPAKWQVFEGNDNTKKMASSLVDQYAQSIFDEGNPLGMAMVIIDNNQVVHRSFGETYPGSGARPRQDSVIRLASITKLMTSEVMIKLAQKERLKITDPLQKYTYHGVRVPDYAMTQPIRLYHLASHTSGLPREQPGGKWGRPVFIWPTQSNRWAWLKTAGMNAAPGTTASYSNLAYDLLADALSKATGEPYTRLLQEEITRPYRMKDTTLTPSRSQCARLMEGVKPSPCLSTIAAAGSGGIYSTPVDMQRWMQQFLSSHNQLRKKTASREQGIYFKRENLTSITGMDVAGQADGIGLGWVYMDAKKGVPGIYQKTGGGGGFNTYMAMIPEQNIGVFVVMTRKEQSKFSRVTNGVNELVAALSRNHGKL